MKLTKKEVAYMVDLSAVHPNDGEDEMQNLVDYARRYGCYLVTTLPCQTSKIKEILWANDSILIGGNVGFPSGGQTTRTKVAEAIELIQLGCDELDMVINIGKLVSGKEVEVFEDIRAVVEAADGLPVKVILECHYLNERQILTACDLCIKAGAAFVKTGTGWAPSGATLENIALIKGHVGEAIGIKASGGIRGLETLVEMYRRGARRFGIGLRWIGPVMDQVDKRPGGIVEFEPLVK